MYKSKMKTELKQFLIRQNKTPTKIYALPKSLFSPGLDTHLTSHQFIGEKCFILSYGKAYDFGSYK